MDIFDFLVYIKVLREHIEGNTRYVGEYFLNRKNPLTYLVILIATLIVPFYCMFCEGQLQDYLVWVFKGLKTGRLYEDD